MADKQSNPLQDPRYGIAMAAGLGLYMASEKPKKPAGPIERAIRRVVLGKPEDRKPLTDEEIRRGVEGGDR